MARKVNGVVTRRCLWDGQLRIVAELDGSGNLVSQFVYGTKVNVPEYMLKGGATYRLITDQLGSVRLVVNASTGAIAQRIDYDEFGVATLVTGTWNVKGHDLLRSWWTSSFTIPSPGFTGSLAPA